MNSAEPGPGVDPENEAWKHFHSLSSSPMERSPPESGGLACTCLQHASRRKLRLVVVLVFVLLRLGEYHAMHMNVDFDHLQARHALDRTLDVLLNLARDFRNASAVLRDDRHIDRTLLRPDFDLYALREVLAAEQFGDLGEREPGDVVLGHAAGNATGHAGHAAHFRCGETCNDLDDFVRDANVAHIFS